MKKKLFFLGWDGKQVHFQKCGKWATSAHLCAKFDALVKTRSATAVQFASFQNLTKTSMYRVAVSMLTSWPFAILLDFW